MRLSEPNKRTQQTAGDMTGLVGWLVGNSRRAALVSVKLSLLTGERLKNLPSFIKKLGGSYSDIPQTAQQIAEQHRHHL